MFQILNTPTDNFIKRKFFPLVSGGWIFSNGIYLMQILYIDFKENHCTQLLYLEKFYTNICGKKINSENELFTFSVIMSLSLACEDIYHPQFLSLALVFPSLKQHFWVK